MNNSPQQGAMADFEANFKAALSAEQYPNESIASAFVMYAVMALQHKSIMSIGCDVPTYEKMVAALDPSIIPNWDLYTISFAINAIESAKPLELAADLLYYAKIVTETRQMAKVWNDLVQPIKERVSNEIIVKNAKANNARNGKKVIPLKRPR